MHQIMKEELKRKKSYTYFSDYAAPSSKENSIKGQSQNQSRTKDWENFLRPSLKRTSITTESSKRDCPGEKHSPVVRRIPRDRKTGQADTVRRKQAKAIVQLWGVTTND